jgi:carbonic anhydrase
VEVLQVRHIIVCGHYGCGGVTAALRQRGEGFVYNWLCHIQDIQRKYHLLFQDLPEEEQEHLLCELNVREQVLHVGQTSILQRAWETGRPVGIHGIIYSLQTGRLIRLTPGVSSPSGLQALRDLDLAPQPLSPER